MGACLPQRRTADSLWRSRVTRHDEEKTTMTTKRTHYYSSIISSNPHACDVIHASSCGEPSVAFSREHVSTHLTRPLTDVIAKVIDKRNFIHISLFPLSLSLALNASNWQHVIYFTNRRRAVLFSSSSICDASKVAWLMSSYRNNGWFVS